MAENKTQPTDASVEEFLAGVAPARRKAEGQDMCALMTAVTGETPVMWGPSIIGFGSVDYAYESGRTGSMPRVGFSPRKTALTLYGLTGHPESADLLDRLGPHTTSVACLYIKRLDAIDEAALKELIAMAWKRD
ncbi:DUF1801 domain-containing protein [Demequina flava]|uniref:DUF1801 domain-containing protein n=1 Tax=Demequina flava TaxID=1095025 RepID=UPI000783C0F0|nr:DUF1801 domain-containing protein [Demequina flava]